MNETGNDKRSSAETVPSHTPGPWRVDQKAMCRVFAESNATVAATGCQSDLIDQWHANARLIAAAPDMLAVLSDILRDEMHKLHPVTCQQIRAAASKATGAVGDRTDGARE